MKIKALAPWFGAKRNLAPKIIELLGEHRVYWEPFCGSMAVLLAKPPCRMETVNDLHGDLINLARVIQDPVQAVQLYRRLRRLLCHEDFVTEANQMIYETPFCEGVERAYWYFIHSWIGRNGNAGCKDHYQNFCRRYTSGGGSPETRLFSAVRSIPAWRRRLQRVAIYNMDALEMLSRIADEDGAAIYVDPPYLLNREQYKHDLTDADHESLADELWRFRKARVVISYYDHPVVRELYSDWQIIEVEVTKTLSHQNRRGKQSSKAIELLIFNQAVRNPFRENTLFSNVNP